MSHSSRAPAMRYSVRSGSPTPPVIGDPWEQMTAANKCRHAAVSGVRAAAAEPMPSPAASANDCSADSSRRDTVASQDSAISRRCPRCCSRLTAAVGRNLRRDTVAHSDRQRRATKRYLAIGAVLVLVLLVVAVVIAAERQDRPPITAENLPVSLTNEIGAGVDRPLSSPPASAARRTDAGADAPVAVIPDPKPQPRSRPGAR